MVLYASTMPEDRRLPVLPVRKSMPHFGVRHAVVSLAARRYSPLLLRSTHNLFMNRFCPILPTVWRYCCAGRHDDSSSSRLLTHYLSSSIAYSTKNGRQTPFESLPIHTGGNQGTNVQGQESLQVLRWGWEAILGQCLGESRCRGDGDARTCLFIVQHPVYYSF